VLEKGRKASRADLLCAFGPEIDGDDERLAALDVITNPVAWNVLCAHHGMALEQAKQVIADLVRALFGRTAGAGGAGDAAGPGEGKDTREIR
jgi:hypothetical protein